MAKETEFEFPPNGHIALVVFDSMSKKWYAVKGTGFDHLQVDVVASDLPDGAATAAKQLADGHGVTLGGEGLQLRRSNHVVASYGAVPGDTNVNTLLTAVGQGVLEWFNFSSDNPASRLYVQLDGAALSCIDPATLTYIGYFRLNEYQYGAKEDSLLKAGVFDSENNHYIVSLKRPIWFNTSILIRYRAATATDKLVIGVGYHLF